MGWNPFATDPMPAPPGPNMVGPLSNMPAYSGPATSPPAPRKKAVQPPASPWQTQPQTPNMGPPWPPPVQPLPPTKAPPDPSATSTLTPSVDQLQLEQNKHLDPIAKGSGLSETDKQGTRDTSTNTTRNNLMVTPDEFNEAYNEWQKSPMYQDQMQGEKLQNSLAMLDASRPIQTDFRPLAAWADSLGGKSNLVAGMPAPETAAQRSDAILKHFQQVQSDRNQLSTNIMQGLKALKGGGYQLSMEQAMQNASIQQSANDPQRAMRLVPPETRFHWMQESVKHDMKDVQDANAAADEAQRLLANGSPISDVTFKDRFLKAAIGGRLSNYDLISQSGDKAGAERLSQAWNTLTQGTLTEKNRAEYRDALQTMIESNRKIGQMRLARNHDVGVTSYSLPEETMAPLTDPKQWGLDEVPQSTLTTRANKSQKNIQKADPSYTSPTATQPANNLQSLAAAEIARRKAAKGQ